MFKIVIDAAYRIKDCPEQGLDAIDFRRAHNLPDGTTNIVRIKIELEDENLCRQFKQYLNANADLLVKDSAGSSQCLKLHSPPIIAYTEGVRYSYHNTKLMEVPAELLSPLCKCQDTSEATQHVHNLLQYLDQETNRLWNERTREYEAAEEARKREEEARKQECQRQEQAIAAKTNALKDWARQNGSEQLRLQIESGLPWKAMAREECFAQQEIGLCQEFGLEAADEHSDDDSVETTVSACENPTLQELQKLKALRDKGIDVNIITVAYERDGEEFLRRHEFNVTVTSPDGTTGSLYLV